MTYLLDTNVVSEIRKPNCDPNVHAWMTSTRGSQRYVSVLVLGEIRRGIEHLRSRDPGRAGVYERWLGTLRRDYADRLVAITPPIAEQWGRFNAVRTLPVIDGLLAATAAVMGLTLVTRNTADVASTGVALLNPFEPRV